MKNELFTTAARTVYGSAWIGDCVAVVADIRNHAEIAAQIEQAGDGVGGLSAGQVSDLRAQMIDHARGGRYIAATAEEVDEIAGNVDAGRSVADLVDLPAGLVLVELRDETAHLLGVPLADMPVEEIPAADRDADRFRVELIAMSRYVRPVLPSRDSLADITEDAAEELGAEIDGEPVFARTSYGPRDWAVDVHPVAGDFGIFRRYLIVDRDNERFAAAVVELGPDARLPDDRYDEGRRMGAISLFAGLSDGAGGLSVDYMSEREHFDRFFLPEQLFDAGDGSDLVIIDRDDENPEIIEDTAHFPGEGLGADLVAHIRDAGYSHIDAESFEVLDDYDEATAAGGTGRRPVIRIHATDAVESAPA